MEDQKEKKPPGKSVWRKIMDRFNQARKSPIDAKEANNDKNQLKQWINDKLNQKIEK